MLDGYDYENLTFEDGRGQYPEDIRSRAPLGTRARLQRKAREEGISNGEVIRRALAAYLAGGFPPAAVSGSLIASCGERVQSLSFAAPLLRK